MYTCREGGGGRFFCTGKYTGPLQFPLQEPVWSHVLWRHYHTDSCRVVSKILYYLDAYSPCSDQSTCSIDIIIIVHKQIKDGRFTLFSPPVHSMVYSFWGEHTKCMWHRPPFWTAVCMKFSLFYISAHIVVQFWNFNLLSAQSLCLYSMSLF